jgi:pyruvate/2-oxoglutarate dehydrogenase complex dihydrolipoamide acyltransferase (E2) component
MRPSRGYALIGAAVLLAVGVLIAVAVVGDGDDESPGAVPTATSNGATTAPVTTEAVTTNTATGVTDTNGSPGTTAATVTQKSEPAATTEEPRTTTSGPATTAPTAPRSYALAPTRRCLLDAGFAVSKVRSTDPRLRALGDLAQRTSLELSRDGQTMGLAFTDTQLLMSLLQVPNDPYLLEARRNALLMYRPAGRAQAKVVFGCLRS